MKALEQRWKQVLDITQTVRQQTGGNPEIPDEALRLLADRDALLHELLSESALSVLSEEELIWLQARASALLEEDALLRKALRAEQKSLQAQLQRGKTAAKAVKAYQQG